MKKKWIIIGLLILALNPVSLFLIWVTVASYIDRNPVFQTHLSTADWLPPEATDISRFSNYNLFIYDCRIPEADFLKLAAKKEWHLSPITEPKEYFPAEHVPKAWFSSDGSFSIEQREALKQKVFQGHFYEIIEDDGGGIRVIYDRPNTRLYFEGRIR